MHGCSIGPLNGDSSSEMWTFTLLIVFWCKMKENTYFCIQEMKRCISNTKVWFLCWRCKIYVVNTKITLNDDVIYLLDAKYILYVKNNDFSYKVIEVIWKYYLQYKDMIFIEKMC